MNIISYVFSFYHFHMSQFRLGKQYFKIFKNNFYCDVVIGGGGVRIGTYVNLKERKPLTTFSVNGLAFFFTSMVAGSRAKL